jgi:hypothetical protein
VKYVYFVRGPKHAAMCEASIASVRKVDRQAVVHVYTDDRVAPEISTADWILYLPDGLPMMMANLEAQCRGLYEARHGEHVAFLDTDVLLLAPPETNLFQYDLAVTWRDHALVDEKGEKVVAIAEQQPYNYGVIIANAGFPAMEAFLWLRERVRRMSTQLRHWYGNQVALASLCGPRPEKGSELEERLIPWTPTLRGNPVRILKMPCELWNYTPQAEDENLELRGALHFKGQKRHLMAPYAKRLGLPWREVA